jgi:hypothetical protein
MVEGENEILVFGTEKLEEKLLDGGARLEEPLTEHAVTGVKQQAETDRHALVRELGDGLTLAVFIDFERIARETRHEMTFGIANGRRHRGQLDSGAEPVRVPDRRSLGAEAESGKDGCRDDRHPSVEHDPRILPLRRIRAE